MAVSQRGLAPPPFPTPGCETALPPLSLSLLTTLKETTGVITLCNRVITKWDNCNCFECRNNSVSSGLLARSRFK